jgi:hypothetical protein
MSKQEVEGSKLVPGAVDPNAFQEQMDGLRRGANPGDGSGAGEPRR